MGFPEEGLDLWQLYDTNREMQIETAYGLSAPITPECGAWSQGAEESPMGWLCLMSWLSTHINQNTPAPYKYTVSETKTIEITKAIYADVGNYMSRTQNPFEALSIVWRRELLCYILLGPSGTSFYLPFFCP